MSEYEGEKKQLFYLRNVFFKYELTLEGFFNATFLLNACSCVLFYALVHDVSHKKWRIVC